MRDLRYSLELCVLVRYFPRIQRYKYLRDDNFIISTRNDHERVACLYRLWMRSAVCVRECGIVST